MCCHEEKCMTQCGGTYLTEGLTHGSAAAVATRTRGEVLRGDNGSACCEGNNNRFKKKTREIKTSSSALFPRERERVAPTTTLLRESS